MKKLIVLLLTLLLLSPQVSNSKTRRRHKVRHVISKTYKKRKKHRSIRSKKGSPKEVYNAVLFNSAKYEVPAEIIFAVLYCETGYRGEDHKTYNGVRVSRCGAVGPMQIIPRYAGKILGRKVTRHELLTNYSTNIEVGVKMLARQYKRYGTWSRALGAYSSGRPKANKYSRKVLNKASESFTEIACNNI